MEKMGEMREEIEADNTIIRESKTLEVESPSQKGKVAKIDNKYEQFEEIDDENEFLKESPSK